MKWLNVKKFMRCHNYGGYYIVISKTSHTVMYFARWESFDKLWINADNNEILNYITHFCIPDPIEIEE